MGRRRQLGAIIEIIVLDEDSIAVTEDLNNITIINDYKKLNIKCDSVISKIKDRKTKK